MKIKLSDYRNIVILTGAGISVASGLNTYRGVNSSKHSDNIEYAGHVDRLKDNPKVLWDFYLPLRKSISEAEPNPAHYFLSKVENSILENQYFTLITQNVDGYHQYSGSKNVIELHGNLLRSRCTNTKCISESIVDTKIHTEPPSCDVCGALIRPDIVLFGEQLPIDAEWKTKQAMRRCDLFVAIGTSGTVSPASNLVRSADYEGARTVLLNLEPMKHISEKNTLEKQLNCFLKYLKSSKSVFDILC